MTFSLCKDIWGGGEDEVSWDFLEGEINKGLTFSFYCIYFIIVNRLLNYGFLYSSVTLFLIVYCN